MRRALSLIVVTLGLALGFAAVPASASVVYELKGYITTSNTDGFIGVLGTVTLTESLNDVHVHVDVSSSGSTIIDTGSHYAFAYNLGALPAGQQYTFTGLSSGFTFDHNSSKNSPYQGPFNQLIACANCSNGSNGIHPTSLDFDVHATGITSANFTMVGGYTFSADISHATVTGVVQTGTVAAKGPTVTKVPEPAPIALLGLGMLALLAARRRTE